MRIAIVHDYLAQQGGAERVVEAMHAVFPDAPIFTSVYDPNATFPSFRDMDVRTSFLQRIAGKASLHKLALPFYPFAFEQFDFSGYDVVLSSASGFAKGVITPPHTCHICYCHTPLRYAWRYHEYIAESGHGPLVRYLLPAIAHQQRFWDFACAQRVDQFVANSYNVRRRVQKYYGRPAEVLYPPVDTHRFRVLPSAEVGDYLLVVSRLVGYKRVELAVDACTRLGLPLKVIGTGPNMGRLRSVAGPQVEFLGRLSDEAVAQHLARCRAFVFPGEEDFGIAPVEAMASGRPVVALRAGGALESIIEGETGLFFDEPTVDSLMVTLRRLDNMVIRPERIRAHAERFDLHVFKERLRRLVERRWAEHRAFVSNTAEQGDSGRAADLYLSEEEDLIRLPVGAASELPARHLISKDQANGLAPSGLSTALWSPRGGRATAEQTELEDMR